MTTLRTHVRPCGLPSPFPCTHYIGTQPSLQMVKCKLVHIWVVVYRHCRSKVDFERLRDRGLTWIKNLVCSFNRYFSMDVIFAKEIASQGQPLLFETPWDLDFLSKLWVITLKDHYRRPYMWPRTILWDNFTKILKIFAEHKIFLGFSIFRFQQ